jgi:hypothetical protein
VRVKSIWRVRLVVPLVLCQATTAGTTAVAKASLAVGAVQPGMIRPLLLAQGEGYLVHGMPYPSGSELEELSGRPEGGLLVTHVDTNSGVMKILCFSGTFAHPTERISFHQSRIAGVAHDARRIYVLEWRVGSMDYPYPAGAPYPVQSDVRGQYLLYVFQLTDGQESGSIEVDAPSGAGAPSETLDAGPLEVVPGGVEIFGQKRMIPD